MSSFILRNYIDRHIYNFPKIFYNVSITFKFKESRYFQSLKIDENSSLNLDHKTGHVASICLSPCLTHQHKRASLLRKCKSLVDGWKAIIVLIF